jgi:hypothetical protein
MSVTSRYQFIQGFFNGLFVDLNTLSNADQPFSESFDGFTFTVHRPNGEILVDLGPQINTDANVGLVSKKLTSAGASLTSQIGVQGVPWGAVPYFFQHPLAHQLTDMLIRIHFDFHIETPWYCTDVDGTISIFLFAFLDKAGHLQVNLDGAWFQFDGGGPFCAGTVSNGLNAAMPGVKSAVQGLLPAITKVASGIKFSRLYFLPGNGTKGAAGGVQNATSDLALGLLL